MDCVFCKIVAGEIPTEILYRDDRVVVFRDIHPVTPVHLLIIPVEHIPSLGDITEANSSIIGHMAVVANQMAKKEGTFERGYRLVINAGEFGGQVVPHLHMHLLGGRRLSSKMAS